MLPQNPWAVPAGYYARLGGTTVYVSVEACRGGTSQGSHANWSTGCVVGE